jgi:glycerophosphoryl diester phosphodiesterase
LLSLAPVHAAVVSGGIRHIPLETAAARELRHAKVAERRAGTILIAHRGASILATENTLEAYAAAMDYGADGCEVDVRRTADGILVLFHDDTLDTVALFSEAVDSIRGMSANSDRCHLTLRALLAMPSSGGNMVVEKDCEPGTDAPA